VTHLVGRSVRPGETRRKALTELASNQPLETLRGAELERPDTDRAIEVIASALGGCDLVIARWQPSRPIRLGLERVVIDDETTIEAALGGTQRADAEAGLDRCPLATRSRPEPRRRPTDWISECGCRQRPREWRRPGGVWTCGVCHPPVDGLDVEYRTGAEDGQ
jgi:hypothetical protein